MAQVTAKITARPPRFYNLRFALAILLIGWAASLLTSAINGIRLEVR